MSECECECEHQGALRDATESAYKVVKPWLMVLDNLFTPALTVATNFIGQTFHPIKLLKFLPVKILPLEPAGEIGEILPR